MRECKKCKTKLALSSSRFTEFTFDDEPYESGSYDEVIVDGDACQDVDSETIIYADICPSCGTVDNVWVDGEAQLQKAQDLNHHADNKHAELQTEIAEKDKQIADLQASLAAKDKQIEGLEGELAKSELLKEFYQDGVNKTAQEYSELETQIAELQARLAKYESQLEKCTQLLDKHWPASMSCNGYLQVAGHLGNILAERSEFIKASIECLAYITKLEEGSDPLTEHKLEISKLRFELAKHEAEKKKMCAYNDNEPCGDCLDKMCEHDGRDPELEVGND